MKRTRSFKSSSLYIKRFFPPLLSVRYFSIFLFFLLHSFLFFSFFLFFLFFFLSLRSWKTNYSNLGVYTIITLVEETRRANRGSVDTVPAVHSENIVRGRIASGATLLTVVRNVVLLLHGIHIGDVVHRHQTGKHSHHHLRFHLGYVLWQRVHACAAFSGQGYRVLRVVQVVLR